ncbi:MAG: arsenate reductase ArsC [Myxococcota bacterium]|jgi:arsenate reductase|nr:arsenate reductase ArsC [Myxococcota bacterium]
MTRQPLTLHLCPNAAHAEAAQTLLSRVAARFELATKQVVDLPAGTHPLFSLGDSVLVNTRSPVSPAALETLIPDWQLEAALVRALQHHGLLFLCVANSARSQLAEGIARALATPPVQVWSAGSRPTQVRPEAIMVLAELGIDISTQRSKSVTEIAADAVDTVITLCGEEECPVFLGSATRLHWGLEDPAAIEADGEARLQAFRRTRDELLKRLRFMLAA